MLGLSFFVEGRPYAKQSFKVGKHGGYTPATVKAWQEAVSLYASNALQMNDLFEPFMNDEPVAVFLGFQLPDKRKVDLDNLSKAVLDGCNGILFTDDRQVFDLHVTKKLNCDEVGVQISVFPMEDE